MASTEIPIPTGGSPREDATVRPVLLLTSVLALVLVLGAGYASIQSASVNTAKRLAAPPAIVRGAPMVGGAEAVPAGSADGAQALPGGLVTHGRVGDVASGESHMPPLPEGTVEIDYGTIALPDYVQSTSMDGVVRPNEEIFPPEVLALEGQRVALLGFMLPVRLDDADRVALEFVLSPVPPGCHFGTMPRADEWIEVDADAMGGTPYLAYRVVRVVGTIELGERYDEYGFLMSLYRIRAERVDELR